MAQGGGSSIACIGGATMDRRALVSGQLTPGTSNPVVSTVRPGGVARNVAEALARLGCRVALYSIVGDDETGRALEAGLRDVGVEISGMTRSTRHPTGAYTAILGPSGRLEFGLADMEIFVEANSSWAARIAASLVDRPFWFLDANLPAETVDALLESKPAGVTVLADPVSVAKAGRLSSSLPHIDVLLPDRYEAETLSRMPTGTAEQVARTASRIHELGVGTVVVTLGSQGVYVADGSRNEAIPAVAPHGPLRDVTGAGDALAAGYLFACSEGLENPVGLGLAAASLVLEAGGDLSGLSAERLIERGREAEEA
jgi:pseudouridine kinase